MLVVLKQIDWAIIVCATLLVMVSLLAIASANPNNVVQQGVWFGLGFLVMFIFTFIDWRPLVTYRWLIFAIYLGGIALLALTFFFAPVIRGTRSWLVIGPAQFQTSEVVKVALIILYSYYFAHRHVGIGEWRNILIPLGYALLPIIFIFLQPDMGTALIIGGLCIIYLLVSGIRWRHIAMGLVCVAILSFIGWNNILEGYQRERIKGLFDPQYDPLGVNYNVIQSKIAIGSGGWWGKGWQQGTQVQLGFLPEAANDFVFAVIAEEWGLIGGVMVIGIFMLLIGRLLIIGLRAENNFSKLMCLGTSGLLLLHLVFNVGSAIGLMPVVGVPLPLISYGGSNLLTTFMLLGIIQSIAVRSVF